MRSLATGFKVSGDELYEAFGVLVPEVSRMEVRYHPRTGRKFKQKVIIKPKHRQLMFCGKRVREDISECLSDEEVLCEKIIAKIHCYYFKYGNALTDKYQYVFGPFTYEDGFAVIPCLGYPIFELLRKEGEFARIGQELRNLGLKADKPEVILCEDIF